ncbi:MAG: flagellar biosynthetic protein flip [Alphaproteobacteria bacterium BRH_c36]|nr:MAG: flagellar biosynthetic protein flip [Alphaproteobacteria bacterium BRH_c36]
MTRLIIVAAVVTVVAATPAAAQLPDLGSLLPEGSTSASGRIVQLVALLTVLSVAPGLLIMVTCFTRFIIALSFLRIGIGLQTTPGNLVLVSLALFLTFYVMAPTFDEAWQTGVKPLIEEKIGEEEAFERISAPFKKFMTQHVRDKDVRLFEELAGLSASRQAGDDIELRVLLPAFMISELRRGFEIGFLIVLPFLVIDLIVATLTMSMGMMMLPPTAISLPFKVLFFVLLDGWYLLVGSLVRSYS